MSELEIRVETCRRGHCWPAGSSVTLRPGQAEPVCPVCGEAVETSRPPDEVGESTVVFSPTRDGRDGRHGSESATTSEPAIPGYAILGVVGQGSAGVVYKARDVVNDRLVALRVIPAERHGTSETRPRFRVEAGSVALRHPNIVPVLAAGQHGDDQYVASVFTEGETLAEAVAGEPLAVFAAAKLAETLARAVHEAEQQGFVHGRLKPANVVLAADRVARFVDPDLGLPTDESGRELVPRITDYGFRAVPGSAGDEPAPVARSGATPPADVRALGAILYFLLTGRDPVEGAEQTGAPALAGEPDLVPPSRLNPKVPRDLEAICWTSLGRDPARRFPDAGVLAAALRQFLDGFVTQFQCGRCGTAIKSTKPLRVGATAVRCPRCGETTLVEAVGGKTPESAPPSPAPAPPPVGSVLARKADVSQATPPASTPAPRDAGPFSRTAGLGGSFPSWTPPSHPSQSQLSGLPVVAGYALLGELGRGGMGAVYKARHEKLKRVVALKMIAVDPEANPQFLARFQAEAEAVARLHHPNIVQIYEVGDQGGWPFLALEFVTGGTLKKRLEGRPQPMRAAAQLVQLLARAVHAAHMRGIVHRDLKPANILLQSSTMADDREGETGDSLSAAQLYGVPKVNDFGLAKRIDDDSELVRIDAVLGTPLYMAPEQAEGHFEEVGAAADIYSLGVILYEMLTGRPPFVSESTADVIRRVVTEAPPPPHRLRRNLHRDLEAVCLRCLEKDPRKRYRSALALADDLERFFGGEPVRARPPAAPGRLWSWALRNPVPSTLLLTVSAVLLFGQYSLHKLANEMVESTAKESAAQQTELLKAVNSFYTEVASRARSAGVTVTHKYPDVEKSIPIPAKFTIELGQRMQSLAESGEHAGGVDQSFMQLKLYSEHPFRQRNDSPPKHKFGKDALAFFQDATNKGRPFDRIERTRAGGRVLRYASPLILEERCLKCHNDNTLYELDRYRKTDWEVGDVRGVLEIVCPLEDNAEQTQRTLFNTYLKVGGVAASVLALSWLALMMSKRHRR